MDLYIGMVQLYIIKGAFIKDIIDNFYFGLLRKHKAKKIVPSQITKDLDLLFYCQLMTMAIILNCFTYEFTQDENIGLMMWLSKVWLDNGNSNGIIYTNGKTLI